MMFTPREMLLLAAPLLFSITLHEYAHARMALAFGDPTAKLLGRVTLNPIAHLDLFGTIALLYLGFGWAKPVPVNYANLRPRRQGVIAVSLAGVATNLMLAVICGLTLKAIIVYKLWNTWDGIGVLAEVLGATMAVNLVLCVFNLVPLFPLDGHHVLREMISPWKQANYMQWQIKYGRLMLMVLLFGPQFLPIPNLMQYMFSGVIDPAIGWVVTVPPDMPAGG